MTSPTPKKSEFESSLIRLILNGRPDLFGELIAPHLGPLSSFVRGKMGAGSEAEDIVQQTALKAFTHLEQFRFEASFRTWLIQIGLNESRQWRRKNAASRLVDIPAPRFAELPIPDHTHSPLLGYQRNETCAQVRAALERLPERYRDVIVMRDMEELSILEVSAKLGLSVPAVKTRHRRARQKVAKLLHRSRTLSRPLNDRSRNEGALTAAGS